MSRMTAQYEKDVKILNTLVEAYSTVIQQGIHDIKQDDIAGVLTTKKNIMNHLQRITIRAFMKMGVDTSSSNRSDKEQQDNIKGNNNKTSSSDAQNITKLEYFPQNKDGRNDRGQNNNNRNQQFSKNNNNLNKAFSHNSQEEECLEESDSEYRNHQSDYEQKNGFYLDRPRRGGLGIPGLSQSASINSYPMDEKRRVLEFFNEHYDPVKRNKIELVELMVKEFGYSKSSLYYLVTNQKMYEAVQKQIEMQARGIPYPQSHSYSANGIPIYSPNTPIASYTQQKFQKDNRGDNRDIREFTREFRDNNRDCREYRDDRQRNSRNQNERERSRSSPDNKNNRRDLRSSHQEINCKNSNYGYADSKKEESSSFQQQQKGNASQGDHFSVARQQAAGNLLTVKHEEEKLNINKQRDNTVPIPLITGDPSNQQASV